MIKKLFHFNQKKATKGFEMGYLSDKRPFSEVTKTVCVCIYMFMCLFEDIKCSVEAVERQSI